jgi:hypothetical protein
MPQDNDAGSNLSVEYLARHTPMVNPTDTPFTLGTTQNTLIGPYLDGIAMEVAGSILQHDPTQETLIKSKNFLNEAKEYMSQVVSIYQRLEEDEPWHMRGGRVIRGAI